MRAADDKGKFALEVKLMENAPNELTVQATSPKGETAKAIHVMRHDPKAGKVEEPPPPPIIKPTLPRNIIVGLKDDYVSILIPEGKDLPLTGQTNQFYVDGGIPGARKIEIPVYEGHMPNAEIPYGPFNTELGTLFLDTPSTEKMTGKIVLTVDFEMNENREIRLKVWFRDDPSIMGEASIKPLKLPRDKTHLIERTERTINEAGERISPDEKARVNRKRQAIIDLCEQYAPSPSNESLRKQIIETGNELVGMVRSIEQKLGLK